MKHRVAVNLLFALWVYCVCTLAAAATFAQDMRVFDYESLMAAALGGLCGGLARTIVTLANDDRIVFSVVLEAWKDLLVSCIAGGFAYLLIIAIDSKWPNFIARDMRFPLVLIAGWARMGIFKYFELFVQSRIDREVTRTGKPKMPTSASVPLEK